jgi:hypothetical protein
MMLSDLRHRAQSRLLGALTRLDPADRVRMEGAC